MQRPPLTNEDGEVRELTADDFADIRPLAEVDPELIEAMKAMRNTSGRSKSELPKARIAFRWNPELVAAIKASGQNYSARVEKILVEAYRAGKL